MFKVYAGIDLFKGRVARLLKGDPSKATFYPQTPSQYAARWLGEGADRLHVVDLDAALEMGDNLDVITGFVKSLNAWVQAGGGVRSMSRARALRGAGVSRVVISSLYFINREEALRFLDALGSDAVALALDFRDDLTVVARGWREKTSLKLAEAVEAALSDGFIHIVATDTSRDGTLKGINATIPQQIEKQHRKHVTYAGGVSTVEDVLALKKLGFEGVVVGKALYEETLSLKDVKKALA
ncbi:MAG: 1-(5-phosphoribosyl)-5-[(5-phosphoribosylamino)methylideneamino] imidazole-4-carboxamide isomerase [Candidatus Caldarchaeum sp.]|nr:1-(5-phosphoribosyl)-5-[(5-phosphoribosylamino)methylideneamino] imidazole-4-carboxamide isomerase [Candidatus Caldarchaeum sp.]MDW8359114.1 1-(5-phosphoribosyl)-5-[(5-phosphoribosylamino)methylideneamino] imidazole-4-carboxamide isomerase [Candidatus Caldarchaeum sp.]